MASLYFHIVMFLLAIVSIFLLYFNCCFICYAFHGIKLFSILIDINQTPLIILFIVPLKVRLLIVYEDHNHPSLFTNHLSSLIYNVSLITMYFADLFYLQRIYGGWFTSTFSNYRVLCRPLLFTTHLWWLIYVHIL